MSFTLALAASSILSGCVARSAEDRMPHAVAVTVAFQDGDYGALIAEFDRPGEPPELRYADGLWAFDGERLLQLSPAPRSGDEPIYDLAVTEHLTGGRHVLVLGRSHEELRVRSVAHTAVALGTSDRPSWIRLSDGNSVRLEHEIDMHRTGPGRGFSLIEDDGDLHLGLPHRDDDLPLFREIREVVSATWLTEVPDTVWDATADFYKVVRLIPAVGEPARVDGDLQEWSRDDALAVDTRGCPAKTAGPARGTAPSAWRRGCTTVA